MHRSLYVRALSTAAALTLAALGTVVASPAASAAPHIGRTSIIQLGYTDQATPRQAYGPEGGIPVGTWLDGGSHTSRAYVTFDLSTLKGQKIYGGRLFLAEDDSTPCGNRAYEISQVEPVNRTPTWNRAPARLATIHEVRDPTTTCARGIEAEVSAEVLDGRRITFEVAVPADVEADASYGRRLTADPLMLVVDYDTAPTVDAAHRYQAGVTCTGEKPYPTLGGMAAYLEARVQDADADDAGSLRAEFAIWPKGDPEARQVFTDPIASTTQVAGVQLPDGLLVDGTTYQWQVRAGDGQEWSRWSGRCGFTYDRTPPPAPGLSVAEYVPGEPLQVTIDGLGDPQVAGFEYSFATLGVPGCESSGEYGQLVCPDPFSQPNTIRLDTAGGTVTTAIPLPDWVFFFARLSVQSIDVAGNVSDPVTVSIFIPPAA